MAYYEGADAPLNETVRQAEAARTSAEATAARQQAQARTFIQEHGAAALDGHTVMAAER